MMPATSLHPSHTYTLRQLPMRDEIVFKSVIRVLQGKTRHTWVHSDTQDAELVLLGDQLPDGAAPAATAGIEKLSGRAVIHVSAHAGAGFRGLAWPLRIADVIEQLDMAGDLIAARMATQASRPAAVAVAQQQAAVHERQQPAPVQALSSHVPADQRVSLSRWPEANLLQRDMRYIKLATVLTGKPVSIIELADRTHYPLQLCQNFVDALNAGALVRVMSDLRELPLGQMAGHNQAAMNGGYAPVRKTHPAEHHGLIARIRSRLEMIVRPSAAR